MTDFLIFSAIYFACLGLFLWRTFSYPMISDRLSEYYVFCRMIAGKIPDPRYRSLNYCVMVTVFPYLVHRLFSLDAFKMFRMTPSLFLALSPAFAYLTSRELAPEIYSLIASGLMLSAILAHSYSDDLGRNAIGWGALSGSFYAVITGHFWLILVFSAILALSHYGAPYFSLFIFGGSWFIYHLAGLDTTSLATAVIALLVALSIRRTDLMMNSMVRNIITQHPERFENWEKKMVILEHTPEGSWLIARKLKTSSVAPTELIPQSSGESITKTFARRIRRCKSGLNIWLINFLSIRDPVLQLALGFTWGQIKWPSKIEFIANWIVLLLLHISLASFVMRGLSVWLVTALFAYLAIWLTVLIPYLSQTYRVIRVYCLSLIFLLPIFSWQLAAWQIDTRLIIVFLCVCLILQSGIGLKLIGHDRHRHFRKTGSRGSTGVWRKGQKINDRENPRDKGGLYSDDGTH